MKIKVEYLVVVRGLKYFYPTEKAAKLKAELANTKYFKVKTLVTN